MKKYLFGSTVIILGGLIYWLSAGEQLLELNKSVSTAAPAYTWLNTRDTPQSVPLIRAGEADRMFYSADRQHFGTVMLDQNVVSVNWYDLSGELIGSFSEPWPFDLALPVFFLDQDLRKCIAVDLTNRMRIFDYSGQLQKEIQLFESKTFSYENNLFFEYCPDRQLVLSALTQAKLPYTSKIRLISLQGEQIWQKKYDDWQTNSIAAAHDAGILIISLYKSRPEENWFAFRTIVLNNLGDQLGELPVQFKTAQINPAQTHTILLDRQHAYLFDIKQNALIAEIRTEDENRLFHAAIFAGDNYLVLQEGDLQQQNKRWMYENIALRTISLQGKAIDLKLIPDIRVYDAVLSYDPENETIFIGHSSGWQQLKTNF